MDAETMIVPATRLHIGPMACAAKANRKQLRTCFIVSSVTQVALIEGQPAAMWGFAGSEASGDGYVWGLFSNRAKTRVKELVRGSRAFVDMFLEHRHEIYCHVESNDRTGMRFAIFLGFNPTGRWLEDRFIEMKKERT